MRYLRRPALSVICLTALFLSCARGQLNVTGNTAGNNAGSNGGATSGSTSGSTAGGNTGGTTSSTPDPTQPIVVPAGTYSPSDPGCGNGQTVAGTSKALYLMFVVDKSGSMAQSNKWTSLKAALKSVFADIAANDQKLPTAVGVNYFGKCTHWNSKGECDRTEETTLEQPLKRLDTTQAGVLTADIDTYKAEGGTPTKSALSKSYDALDTYVPPQEIAGGAKAVVLMSDGKPTPDDPTRPSESENPIPDFDDHTNLVSVYRGKGIKTYSVGIGELGTSDQQNGYSPLFMSQIASLGGTATAGCSISSATDPTTFDDDASKFCHFQITPSAQSDLTQAFVNTINSIRQSARECVLNVKIPDPKTVNLNDAKVVFDVPGQPQILLPRNSPNGWSFDNDGAPQSISLNGQACTDMQQTPNASVFAILGCVGSTEGGGGSTGGGSPGG